MKKPIKQIPTFVNRTYRGGRMLGQYLHLENPQDSFTPEDWISSFTVAKNREYIENEGITRVYADGRERLITEVVEKDDFGEGYSESGVLIKFLDAAERLGIQVHPTCEYASKVFGTEYGKTECWYILGTRDDDASVYIGFREDVTREKWASLFHAQDIDGMLHALHRFRVKAGDTVLVRGGTPHAIGAGCFLLEIQEPSDYTMRAEKVTVAGEKLTPMQIHYGVGEEKMLDCFTYAPCSRAEAEKRFFLTPRSVHAFCKSIVSYEDTPCFALDRVDAEEQGILLRFPFYTTVVVLSDRGSMTCDGDETAVRRGDKFFIPAETEIMLRNVTALVCRPPKRK